MIVKPNNIDDKSQLEESMKSVWVPNRNGLFLNIAASYCDKLNIDYIVFGANLEESAEFSDNRKEFTRLCNEVFLYSTMVHPEVIAPCAKMKKVDLV